MTFSRIILSTSPPPQVPVIYAALGYTGMFLLAGAVGVTGVINNVFLPSELSPAK